MEQYISLLAFLIFLWAFIYPFYLCWKDKKNSTHESCDKFGWHDGDGGSNSFDGCSVHAKCSKCGKGVMQDSQGNWFQFITGA